MFKKEKFLRQHPGFWLFLEKSTKLMPLGNNGAEEACSHTQGSPLKRPASAGGRVCKPYLEEGQSSGFQIPGHKMENEG